MRIAVPRAHCRPPVPLFSFWTQSPRQSRALITKQVSDPFSPSRPVEDLDGDPAQISSNQRTGPHEYGLFEQCPTTRWQVRAAAFHRRPLPATWVATIVWRAELLLEPGQLCWTLSIREAPAM